MAAKGSYTVERHIHVDAPVPAVRDRIVDLRRWTAWSPWEDLDPELGRTYSGAASGVGATYEWSGNRKAGAGRMEVVSVDDRDVTIDLQFERPFRSHSTIGFTLAPDAAGTLVTWTMTGPVTPMTRVMGLFRSMDAMIGPDFERGLARLKDDAEGDVPGSTEQH